MVRARRDLDLPELSPAHRLDRLTAGLLVLTTRREYRGAYAGLFQRREVRKTYEALARFDPALEFPRRVTGRIEKRRGRLQAEVVDGEPNAEAFAEAFHERLVAVGFRAPQLVVQVRGFDGDLQLILKRQHHVEQAHRIFSARDGADKRCARGNQLVFPEIAENVIPHASTPDRRTSYTAASTAS